MSSSKVRIKTGDALIPENNWESIAAPEKLFANKYDSVEELTAGGMMVVYEDLLRLFVATKTYVTLWGPVGAGKTRTVEAMARETDNTGRNYNVITMQPSTIDPTSLHGLLTIEENYSTGDKVMKRAIPDPAQQVFNAFNNNDQISIMFLDEMTTCNPSQQQALLGLLTHGQYGEMNIEPYVTFVSAANPPGTVSAVNDLEESVINRGAHIPWYTDHDLYLSKYENGFGVPSKRPGRKEFMFVKELINSNRDVAFRDDPSHYEPGDEDEMWTIDNLVPYDRMTFSGRMAEEVGKVYRMITKALADAPYSIRKLYIEECVKAFVGPNWGEAASKVYDYLETLASTESSVNAVNKFKINNMTTLEEIQDYVGDSLHRVKDVKMSHVQEQELAELFESEIFFDGFREKLYLAFWVWLSTSDSPQRRQHVIPIAVRILDKAKAVASETVSANTLMPKFIPREIKMELAEIIKRAKEMEG